MTEQRSEQPSRESLETAKKWLDHAYGDQDCGESHTAEECLARLLDREKAKAALAEAKWWHTPQDGCHERIAMLEQAVAGQP